jgi:hypothetical protein
MNVVEKEIEQAVRLLAFPMLQGSGLAELFRKVGKCVAKMWRSCRFGEASLPILFNRYRRVEPNQTV